jgi:DNA-binding response OmpR family regulator
MQLFETSQGARGAAMMRGMPTRKKILIVDDSKTVRALEKALLASHYDLVEAQDGEEALVKAKAGRPDLILLDVVMPKLDGFETCRRLREMPETANTPVIIVSTRGESENVVSGFTNGCNDYVTKPLNGPELLAKIRSYIE